MITRYLGHPAVKRAMQLYGQADRHEAVATLVDQWESAVAQVDGMDPGNAAAQDVLFEARDVLAKITMEVGTVHGWSRAQRCVLHQHAVRLLGPEQRIAGPPSWIEDR
jgi:hypothetical protein